MAGWFDQVRTAFANGGDRSLRALGVKQGKTKSGVWQSVNCPCCTDTNGSASISMESGWLRCHQCGLNVELFTWYQKLHGLTDHVASLRAVAQALGVSLDSPPKRKGRPPRRMTKELAEQAVVNLLEADWAEPLREFLKQRGLWKPAWFEVLGIGALEQRLVLIQRSPPGQLLEYYRSYDPATKRWSWVGPRTAGASAGVWPWFPIGRAAKQLHLKAEDVEVLLFEGEWDCLTALLRAETWRQGLLPYTWTGGALSKVKVGRVPADWKKRRVHVIYDNDTFQGPDPAEFVAPSDKRKSEGLQRRKNLVHGVAMPLRQHGCTVILRKIPLNPVDQWGGDYRDWIDAGGVDLDQIEGFTLDEVLKHEPEEKVEKVAFDDIGHDDIGKLIEVRVQLQSTEHQPRFWPTQTAVRCSQNFNYCTACRIPSDWPGNVITWDENALRERVELVMQNRMGTKRSFIEKHVVEKPRVCDSLTIEDLGRTKVYVWQATRPAEDPNAEDHDARQTSTYTVISVASPPLTGEIKVTGRVYDIENEFVIDAHKVEEVHEPLRLDLHEVQIRSELPHESESEKTLRAHLAERCNDLATNVTHIYGRPELHIAMDLMMHSVLWWKDANGDRRRGWLDVCWIGPTRTGKTEVARKYLNHVGLGKLIAPSSMTIPGLTIGAQMSRRGAHTAQPGLYPRMHRKALVLDEFHHLVERRGGEELIHTLQSARDIGIMNSVKIYGDERRPAAVRLLTICNFSKGRRAHYPTFAHHVEKHYVTGESLARLDLALGVDDAGVREKAIETDHVLTGELLRTTVLRAWEMEPDQVHIPEEVHELIADEVDSMADIYAEEMPFFTGNEKRLSVTRIAIAFANMVCSHPEGRISECLVRPVHAQLAVEFLKLSYESIGYDRVSAQLMRARRLSDPFAAELDLVKTFGLKSSTDAARVLPLMLTPIYNKDLEAMTVVDSRSWGIVLRRGLMQSDTTRPSYLQPTTAGSRALKNMLDLACDEPAVYEARMRALETWGFTSRESEPSMHPITASYEELCSDFDSGRRAPILSMPQG